MVVASVKKGKPELRKKSESLFSFLLCGSRGLGGLGDGMGERLADGGRKGNGLWE